MHKTNLKVESWNVTKQSSKPVNQKKKKKSSKPLSAPKLAPLNQVLVLWKIFLLYINHVFYLKMWKLPYVLKVG